MAASAATTGANACSHLGQIAVTGTSKNDQTVAGVLEK